MSGHTSFEDSVDPDTRMTIPDRAHIKFRRPRYCWEAKGPVAEAYTLLEPRIREELNQSRSESSREVAISLFMVGRLSSTAKPTIIISSTDKTSRAATQKTIENSGILRDTYFQLGSMRHPPTGQIEPVALDHEASHGSTASTSPCEVFFDPSEAIRPIGIPIYIKQDATKIRRATANVIHDGTQFRYITAAHVFDEPESEDHDTDDEDDVDLPPDSDDDDPVDEDMDVTSRYSGTSQETSDSEPSILSVRDTMSHSSSLCTSETEPSDPPSGHQPTKSRREQPVDLVSGPHELLPDRYRLLGYVNYRSAAMRALDFAVISISDAEVLSAFQQYKDRNKYENLTVNTTNNGTKSVLAWTLRGRISGVLLETTVPMRLRGSETYENVYRFMYFVDGDVRNGDCGTLVTDSEGKALYGHIIAISESGRSRIAYMMAADRTLKELAQIGRWHLLKVKNDAPPERSVEGTTITLAAEIAPSARHGCVHSNVASPRSPPATLILDTALAQRNAASRLTTAEDSPSHHGPSSFARLRRIRTQHMSPPAFSSGGLSLLFQVFAWCIHGYDVIADASRSHDDFENLSKFKEEQSRLVSWAKQIKLDYTDDKLTVNHGTKLMVLDLVDQQRLLLFDFLEYEKRTDFDKITKKPLVDSPVASEASSSSVRQPKVASQRTDPEKTTLPIGQEEVVQKALAFVRRWNGNPERLRGVYHDERSKELVEKMTALNERIQGIAMQFGSSTAVDFDLDPVVAQLPGSDEPKGTKLCPEDLTFSGDQTLATLEDDDDVRTDACYQYRSVWIEWKSIDLSYPGYDIKRIEERVERLSAALEEKTNDSYQSHLPRSLGYFEDEINGRFGMVFEKPLRAVHQAPVSLYSLLCREDYEDDSSMVPSLNQRIYLMRVLSETIARLHTASWLHKGLRSANILFFNKEEVNEIDYSDPCVSGFDYSRPAGRGDMTEQPPDDPMGDLYRHPFVQTSGNKGGFKKSHDIYSLGVILLEIAWWKPLDHILDIDMHRARPKDVYRVRQRLLNERKWLKTVKSNQGDTVEHIIRICLEGPSAFDVKEDLDKSNDETEAALQRAFSEEVVTRLQDIRGL